jgi:Holliday junction resolvase RusA-like endonuclease
VKQLFEFTVYGTPDAKGRPRFARRGKFVQTYTPKKTISYESLVQMAFQQVYPRAEPIAGAVKMMVIVFIEPPKSWSKKKRGEAIFGLIQPTGKSDIDNYAKIVMDALNSFAYVDDSQAVQLFVEKKYCNDARVFVSIEEL